MVGEPRCEPIEVGWRAYNMLRPDQPQRGRLGESVQCLKDLKRFVSDDVSRFMRHHGTVFEPFL